MRIPPYYRNPSIQRFFVGMVMGGIISWFIFLFIFGESQEKYSIQIKRQSELIKELKEDKKIWQEEFQELNQKNEKRLTVQEIKVNIINSKKYDLDSYSKFEMENLIKDDLNMLEAKDIETVYKNRDLMMKTIENKRMKINDKRFQFRVTEIVFYTTLSIQIELFLAD
ncbi:sporulation membrane protein YtrI [Bacillus sp. 03113]|uniref:sporulation membrane protein YtrI n=1 Tax=Bacillus sp. 03113 TaxID=2578211 RepID=UPI0011431935|nr:sporulation membrane protein YtrI [Bacillus sp. 03113]